MATITKNQQTSISTNPISRIVQWIASIINRSNPSTTEKVVPQYTEEDYYQDRAREEAERQINKVRNSVYYYPR